MQTTWRQAAGALITAAVLSVPLVAVAAPASAATAPSTVKINEVESDGDKAGDWIELVNTGTTSVDISGLILKDSENDHSIAIPKHTSIAAGGYFAQITDDKDIKGDFGLGSEDSARLFGTDGKKLLDSYSWDEHADTTYGRCPDGTGAFTTTDASTRGAKNDCGDDNGSGGDGNGDGGASDSAWPGGSSVATADVADTFGENLSGLAYEGSGSSARGTLWAVDNGPGTLYKLNTSDNGKTWKPTTSGSWREGKDLHYPNGDGDPDAEGVTLTDAGAAGGVYVSTERDNDDDGKSLPEVLRFDPSDSGSSLDATDEWDLSDDLPELDENLGLEGIAYVPDSFLVSEGFRDQETGSAYDPSDYPGHGDGLFFVGVEQNATVYAYALGEDGDYDRVASFASGLSAVMELTFDDATGSIWAHCDDSCDGQATTLQIGTSGAFGVTHRYDRPASMPNINNEGFAIAPDAECVNGAKPAFWSDDSETDGHALRAGTVSCTVPARR